MSEEQSSKPAFFSQIDISQGPPPPAAGGGGGGVGELTSVLREILSAQDRQNELMEEMVNQLSAQQRQRAGELSQWKQANPHLARNCRLAAESLSKVQTEYLENLTEEINDNYEILRDGEFMLNEFVDRFGPRVAHLNGLLQVLSQLSASPDQPNTPNSP
jgi:hypothetical protein